ncbi:MAG: hypothetical protein WCP18_02285 [bacterium]
MENQSHKLNSDIPNPNPELFDQVMGRISQINSRAVKAKVFLFSLLSICSIAGLIPLTNLALNNLSNSEFYQFFSLLFSDSDAIFRYWQSFALAIIETLPILEIALVLLMIIIFLESIKMLSQNLRLIHKTKLI